MPTAAKARTAPPPADRLSLRAVSALAAGAVNAATGTISGVSLITADREAAGHGVWIDNRTLETFRAQLSGRPLKAYATHGMWGGDGTLDEVGLWSDPVVDTSGPAAQLRENFTALDSWRKHSPDEFDTLFELAQKAPSEFGASLAFRFDLAWVHKDGSELPTQRKWRSAGMWDYEPYFDPPVPPDALRDMPSVRAVEVYSADFVDTPAANDGLFRAGAVDVATNGVPSGTPATPQSTPLRPMYKDLYAKFHEHPKRLQRALELHTNDEKLSADAIFAKIEQERIDAELKEFKAKLDEQTAALSARDEAIKSKDAELAKLQSDLKTANDSLAALRASGTARVPTGEAPAAASPAAAGVTGWRRAGAAFSAALTAAGVKKPV